MHMQTLDDPPHSGTWRGLWLKRKAGWPHAGRSLWRKLRGGTTPSAADFAAGTRMSAAAEDHGVVVLYPEQAMSANVMLHGDEDTLVHPGNGEAIHSAPGQARSGRPAMRSVRATTLPRDGQRGFTRTVDVAADGVTRRELWMVRGAGHAWAGGSGVERHTDASGPDASREMLRFFLQHRRTV
jgi:poly(3-hydroxybutyrate) depolymerase